ncbi:unnamed protein product [Fraxinus pennsylvanica]|uniref:Late embryogenesis abundant protein ECP63-like domain-containing protein n=1 Tax=Fraxinus pennsylvanica TaxID=56036 RepID=A0AAD1YUX8_9LAMI|nr:unnamed protein product [Fraxinus pennsylvanica]
MISISIVVGVAAYGEAKFDTWGVILQLGALAFEATRLVMIQILLTSKGRRVIAHFGDGESGVGEGDRHGAGDGGGRLWGGGADAKITTYQENSGKYRCSYSRGSTNEWTTRGVADTAAERGQQSKDYTMQKAKDTKDSAMGKTGDYAIDMTKEMKDSAAEKVRQAKDATMEKMGEYKDYAAEKAKEMKDTVEEKASEYIGASVECHNPLGISLLVGKRKLNEEHLRVAKWLRGIAARGTIYGAMGSLKDATEDNISIKYRPAGTCSTRGGPKRGEKMVDDAAGTPSGPAASPTMKTSD